MVRPGAGTPRFTEGAEALTTHRPARVHHLSRRSRPQPSPRPLTCGTWHAVQKERRGRLHGLTRTRTAVPACAGSIHQHLYPSATYQADPPAYPRARWSSRHAATVLCTRVRPNRELLEPGQVAVSESGIRGRKDIETLLDAGIWNFLIGESLVRSAGAEAFLGDLLGRGIDQKGTIPNSTSTA